MSVGSVQASGGIFTVTDANGQQQRVDLGTLMMMLNLQRTENLDQQIAIQLEEIKERNDLITQLTEFMAACRKAKADGTQSVPPKVDETKLNKLEKELNDLKAKSNPNQKDIDKKQQEYDKEKTKVDAAKAEAAKFTNFDKMAEDLGIPWSSISGGKPSNKDKAAEWDTKWSENINNIKSKIDMLNNDSQMDNIKLQNLLEKRGNSFEMATKVMDTNNQSIQSILRNL